MSSLTTNNLNVKQLLSKRERGALSESSNNSTNGSGFLANSISSPGEHPTEVFSQVSNPGMHNNSSGWSIETQHQFYNFKSSNFYD